MNDPHMELLVTDGWRDLLRDLILPHAFNGRPMADLGEHVLEIGPGPGLTTDLFAVEIPRITAVEFDGDIARDLAERFADSEVVTVVEGDATAMTFGDNTFTGALSFTMLHHVPEPQMQDRLFGEVRRVLQPGGLFVASDSVTSPDFITFHTDDICNPINPEGLEERLVAAGFVDIDVRWNGYGWASHARA